MRFVFFFILFFLSPLVSAETYYWTISNTGHYPDPRTGCEQYASSRFAGPTSVTNVIFSSPHSGICSGEYAYGVWSNIPFSRVGDSCPAGAVYNQVTGACDTTNKCASKKDQSQKFVQQSTSGDIPTKIQIDGCNADVSRGKCYTKANGQSICNGTATFDGNQSSGTATGESTACNTDSCEGGESQPEVTKQDCVYSSNGSGGSSCVAELSKTEPGQTDCGTFNGSYTCIKKTDPKADITKTNSTKTSTANIDGTRTETNSSVTNNTTCTGKTCTTTSTTTTTKTTTDSTGKVISKTTSCSGKCTSGGQASGSSTGVNGGGVSTGTGTGNGSGTQGPGPDIGTLGEPEKDSFDGEGDEWDKKIDEAKQEFKEGLDRLKDEFKALDDLQVSGSGGALYCPPAVTVLGKSISFCLDKYTGSLSWIGSAIFALCAMTALLIVFS